MSRSQIFWDRPALADYGALSTSHVVITRVGSSPTSTFILFIYSFYVTFAK